MKENVRLPGLEDVAPLKAFDPKAFLDDDPEVQKVCDFVLALALIFNDFKDLRWAANVLGTKAPPFEENFHETPEWGHFTGLDHHIHRLLAGVIVELARLLDEGGRTIRRPLFQRVLGRLETFDRDAWNELTAPDSELRRQLLNIRDKTAFHYYCSDTGRQKVLADGYSAAFGKTGRRPYVSIGRSLFTTRFYFADAAALEMDKLVRPPEWKERLNVHATRISSVLSAIVVIFLGMRAGENGSEASRRHG